MLLVGVTDQSFAFHGPPIPIFVPVPVPAAPVVAPVAVVPGPFFYGGFWWWNDGGVWRRSYYNRGPWHAYRGRIPYGVAYYRH